MLEKLIQRLQNDLYSKEIPGEILLNLREKWLDKFLTTYSCDVEVLSLGFILADYKLQEATMLKKPKEHIRMALEYAEQIFEKYEIEGERKAKIKEIIETHHGGEQIYLESKLFRNADSLAHLEPKGWLNLFGFNYKSYGEFSFTEALDKVSRVIEEKKALVDLDEETLKEAEKLYLNYKKLEARIKK